MNGLEEIVAEIDGRWRRLRELNDRFRTTARGGMIVMTDRFVVFDVDAVRQLLLAVAAQTEFDAETDCWGLHECGELGFRGYSIAWRIEAFDRTRTRPSPDAANPKVTVRVLTLMFADECS